MTQFNFKRGSATKKGTPIHTIRAITKNHWMYPFLFTESGMRRSEEETKRLLKEESERLQSLHPKM